MRRNLKRTMCLWLPNWAIQRVRVHDFNGQDRPLILWTKTSHGAFVVTARSHSAAAGGVKVGMPRAEAEALWPKDAVFLRHDPPADLAGLRTLARVCDRYTPVVALEPPECLLLDITGSSHLFGGEQGLATTAALDFQRRGYTVHLGIADGIGAAWAVAAFLPSPPASISRIACEDRSAGGEGPGVRGVASSKDRIPGDTVPGGEMPPSPPAPLPLPISISRGIRAQQGGGRGEPEIRIVPPGRNAAVIPALPIDCLRLSPEALHLLRQFDIETVQQLLELPRGQLASRFGDILLTRIDQALGRIPEIATPERPVDPPRVSWVFEEPASHPATIAAVLERLVRQLIDELSPRNLGVRRLTCRFKTADKSRRDFSVGLLHPSNSAERVLGLVRLKLETLRLPAEVMEIIVRAVAAPIEVRQEKWFDDSRHRAGLADFVERLSSRLGEDAVLKPRLCADDQPEFAGECVPWVRDDAAPEPVSSCHWICPVDLLPQPSAIDVETRDDQTPTRFAWRDRTFEIARVWGPQRLDTGWWRGHDIHRDYYRVETRTGERFWLFRDRVSGEPAWFLHGVFA